MVLNGNSLGKRQQELNIKVNDAALTKISFEEIKDNKEKDDTDRLFKIDLASKYRNVEYLIETLKSEDTLYISRTIKCLWLYEDKYSNFINPDNLHHNVFPFMSPKMIKKFLTVISTYVRNQTRAEEFYNYCMSVRLRHFAYKFLIFTSVEFKTNMIENNMSTLQSILDNDDDLVFFIGDNFSLAELYMEKIEHGHKFIWSILRHLYSLDAERYLNRWEKLFDESERDFRNRGKAILGLRVSRDIMQKYKNRVLKHIHLYLTLVNKNVFCKLTTVEEAKKYLIALLPEKHEAFWSIYYSRTYEFLLNLIPREEKYKFLKTIFRAKYANCEFEMTKPFYDQMYYEFMSIEEREAWALQHLRNTEKSFLSNDHEDREFIWYKFVNYDAAIDVIKKYVLITPDPDKRAERVNVLIESARNQDQLERLFKYYYGRHVNEDRRIKESFLEKVIEKYLIWEFNQNSWEAFNKLLYSIELYNVIDINFGRKPSIIIPVLFYYILHNENFPEGLRKYVDLDINFYYVKSALTKISVQDERDKLFQYLLNLHIDKIATRCDNKNYDENIKREARNHIGFIKELFRYFEKSEKELPEIVVKFMKLDDNFTKIPITVIKLNENDMIKALKQDSQSALSKIPLLKEHFNKELKLTKFLNKLKIYYAHDVAQDFLKYFVESLSSDLDYKNLFAAVHGIYILAGLPFKSEFLIKHAPADPKIDRSKMCTKDLYIQEALCRLAIYSRPLVPLNIMKMYITGDYVRFCLPMIYMYVQNLPTKPRTHFVESLLNSPVSIQKHGLRLAFCCFGLEKLRSLILNTWKKSKNISTRMVLYTNLFKEMLKREGSEQTELLNVIVTLMQELKEDDHQDVMNLLKDYREIMVIPQHLRNKYLEAAWKAVCNFPDNSANYQTRIQVLNNIRDNIDIVDINVAREIVNEYLKDIFINKQIQPKIPSHVKQLQSAKFDLVTTFIATHHTEECSLEFVKMIIKNCLESWKDLPYQNYCNKFILELENKQNSTTMNVIFEYILKELQEGLPIVETYLVVWRLMVLILTNRIIGTQINAEHNKESVKNEQAITTAKTFAKELMNVINKFVDKDNFSLTLLNEVSDIVQHFVRNLVNALKLPSCNIWYDTESDERDNKIATRPYVTSDDVYTFVAEELTQYKMFQATLVALKLIPRKGSVYSIKEYELAINNINMSPSFEVQSFYYQKFVRDVVE